MKNFITLIIIFIGILSGQPETVAKTGPAGQMPIAVLTLEGRGISSQEADILTERMRSVLVQDGRYQVVERSQMDVILEEQGFQLSGCVSNECLVQAGLILGVQQMVGGTVGLIGDSYALDIRLFDVESSRILMAVTRNYSGPVDGLLSEVGAVAREISGADPVPAKPVHTPGLITEQSLEHGLAVMEEAFETVGDVIDTTAHHVAKMLKPREKDPDIARGKTRGKLDAQDYNNRFIWFLPTVVASGTVLYSYGEEKLEDQIGAGLIAGIATKWIVNLIAGDPRLPDHLVKKIESESIVFQDNYRRSWQKEVRKIRSNRADSGCILGIAVGYTALNSDDENMPWNRGRQGN